MCVLPDHEIVDHIKTGKLKIENYSEESLTPNGYDLRISEISIPETGEMINMGVSRIPPRTMFFVSTIESVGLPHNISAQLWLRTSWIRKGILAGLGKVDAGFNGTLTFMGYNCSHAMVEIPTGSRFVQIVFESLHSAATLAYEKRSGHYQGQKGITLSPVGEKKIEGVHGHGR